MSIKRIYLVRHGESEANVGDIPERARPALTEEGRRQAEFVAERATKLPIQSIVASTLLRAEQTAGVIGARLGLDVHASSLFVERRRPSALTDMPNHDPIFVEAEESILNNFRVPGYRHSDEENFDDLKSRAKKALAYLAERPEDEILVVTHGFFLRALIAYVTFGESLTAHECDQMLWAFRTKNTGITVLMYDEAQERPWWVYVWNDHAHLG